MRGVVSAGMTAALERLALTTCFDLVVGASAGAINGAALIGGVARYGAATYHGPLASRSFVNPARVLRGRPVIDVTYVLKFASPDLDAARHDRVLDSPIELHCVAVSVEDAQPVALSGMSTKRDLWNALLASSRMPWAGGPPVEIDGRRYLDGGLLGAPVPVAEAIAAGATHVLVLQTRPYGEPRKSASKAADLLIERLPSQAQPSASGALRRPLRQLRACRERHRAAHASPRRRAAARAGPAAAGRDPGGVSDGAALPDPGRRGHPGGAHRRAGAVPPSARPLISPPAGPGPGPRRPRPAPRARGCGPGAVRRRRARRWRGRGPRPSAAA